MEIVLAAIAVLAFLAWLVAVVSWVMAVRNRAPGVSLGTLLINGIKAFDPASFDEVGKVHQRRFLKAFAAFFLLLFVTIAIAVVSSTVA